MNFIESFFPAELIEAFGWMIFHSVWQGALISIITLAVIYLLKSYSPQLRYIVAYSSLMIVLICASITFYRSYKYAHEKSVLKETFINNPDEVVELIKTNFAEHEGEVNSEINMRWLKFRGFLQRNFNAVFLLWLAGVIFFLFRMTGGMTHIYRMRTRQTFPVDKRWLNYIEIVQAKMGIRKKVQVLQSAIAKAPMVIGYFKPVILIPVSIVSGLSVNELEAVLAHEMAHIRRHDYILNLIQSVIETLFFFHPGVWYISNVIRNEREHSSDELAIKMTGDKISFVKALAQSQEILMSKKPAYALAFSTGKGNLLQRVKRIKNQNNMKNNVTEGFIAASVVFISLLFLSFTFDSKNLKTDKDYLKSDNTVDVSELKKPKNKKQDKIKTHNNPDHFDDSLSMRIAELKCARDEVEQLVEIAYTDKELHEEIALSIEQALKEIDIEQIMKEVELSLKEAEIDKSVRMGLEEARRELDPSEEGYELAVEVIDMASEIMESIDIDAIVNSSLKGAMTVLESIDIEAIINTSVNASKEGLKALEELEELGELEELENLKHLEDLETEKEIKEDIQKEFEEGYIDHSSGKEEKSHEETLDELENEE
ncbi:MAG: M56 family metallopeptidase [Bacteroidales bacterium]|nr:M56 family metallopeptidase [Bacteroidales bacterium]